MSLTTEQQQAAHAPGSVAVIAGAGTGKTHMLAERYLFHLQHHGLTPLEIVAVTFTEKAADELRARIRKRVMAALPERADHQAELEVSQIGTIHGLATRICREHHELAGVHPDFVILDELEGSLWQAEALDEAIAALPASTTALLPYSLLRSALAALLTDPVTARAALAADPARWPDLLAEAKRKTVDSLVADDRWQSARQTLEAVQAQAPDAQEDNRRLVLQAMAEVAAGETAAAGALAAMAGIDLRKGSKKNWPEGGLETVKAVFKELRELAKEALAVVGLEFGSWDETLRQVLPELQHAFQQVDAFIRERKRRQRRLDFADLEVHALQALEHESVRAYYRQRWRAFLIDEFQDTNAVQAAILGHLCDGSLLTIVGDEQQSIYGFRRADVRVFRQFREHILAAGGSEVVLTTSFRTHGDLVGQTNRLFAPVLDDLHQPLHAHRTASPHAGPHLSLHVVAEAEKTRKESRQRVEARHIARLLRQMLDEGRLVHDKASGDLRPLRPGDIAILSRTWDPLEAYGGALAAQGIPSIHAGGGNLLETRTAIDGWMLLRFLADPLDDLAVVALLRSPFVAVSDRVLFEMAKEGVTSGWWQAVYDSVRPELAHARHALRQLRDAARDEAPSQLLRLADRLCGYTAVLANLASAERRLADWQGFLGLVAQLERGHQDVFAVVRRLRRLIREEVSVPRPPLEAGDAVALMTIHAAKGLEWPVVVVPDLSRRLPGDAPAVRFDADYGAALRFSDDDGEAAKPVLYSLLQVAQKDREDAEAKRVLYVALTRARDHLMLSATEGKGGGLEHLAPGLDACELEAAPIPFTAEDALPPAPVLPKPPAMPTVLLDQPVQWDAISTLRAAQPADVPAES